MAATIAELIMERGRQLADARRRSGDISARMYSDLGNIASGAIQSYAQEKADAPAREDAARLRALQIEGAEQNVAAGQREIDEAEQDKRRDTAFMGLFEMYPDGNIPDREVLTIYGPDRGAKVAQGMKAFTELSQKRVTNAQETAGRLAVGAKALSPQLRMQFWPAIRSAAVAGGLGTEQDIPAEPTDEYLDAVIGWSSGKESKAERVTFGPVKRLNVDGATVLAREGSDGLLYNVRDNKPIQGQSFDLPDESLAGGNSDYSAYLERNAREMGKTRATLTAAEEDRLRTRFYALGRAPREAGGGGTGRGATAPKDDPKFPRGVEDYILSIRNRGTTQAEALAEVLDPATWRKLRTDHPSLSSERVREAIAKLIPEEGAAVSAGAPVSPAAGAPASSRPPAGGQKSMTRDELRYSAQRLGVSEQEARRLAESNGYVIR
jgi:hypothetical protein